MTTRGCDVNTFTLLHHPQSPSQALAVVHPFYLLSLNLHESFSRWPSPAPTDSQLARESTLSSTLSKHCRTTTYSRDYIIGNKFRKALPQFIDDIPDSKLEGGFPSSTMTIWHNDNYRLDMQGLTTDAPRCWNLQVQVNKQVLFTSAKRAGKNGASVAKVLIPIDAPYSAADIKEMLKECAIAFGEESNQF